MKPTIVLSAVLLAILAAGGHLPAYAESPASQPAADRVVTRFGDTLVGRVIGLTADGKALRFVGAAFDGEVRLPTSALDAIALPCPAAGAAGAVGPDTVVLANGDRITGRLRTLAPDAATVQSDLAGLLTVRRRGVAAIHFRRETLEVLLASRFDRGDMDPWRTDHGRWQIKAGQIVSDASDWNTLATPLDHRRPVTFEVLFDPQAAPPQVFSMSVCDGSNACVFGEMKDGQFRLGYIAHGGGHLVERRPIGDAPEAIESLRLSFDPDSGAATLWRNDKVLLECVMPDEAPRAGSQVWIGALGACRVRSLRVLDGLWTAPLALPPPADATDTVLFTSGEKIAATAVTLADGACTMHIAGGGKIESAARGVLAILFRRAGLARVTSQPDDAFVQTAAGGLTLRLESLTDSTLTGVSGCLGRLTIKRSAVRSIKFNVGQ